jgi:hypothetical protein
MIGGGAWIWRTGNGARTWRIGAGAGADAGSTATAPLDAPDTIGWRVGSTSGSLNHAGGGTTCAMVMVLSTVWLALAPLAKIAQPVIVAARHVALSTSRTPGAPFISGGFFAIV